MNSTNCVIYCTDNMSINELRIKIAAFIGSDKIEVSFIEKDFYELSVYVNDEFDANGQVNFPDGFLYFRFIIDVGFNPNSEISKCVDEISKILKWLWGEGIPSVASCDYEDLLPEKGGYNSKLVPFPSLLSENSNSSFSAE